MRKVFISIVLALSAGSLFAQPVPGVDENIPYLQTFGKDSSIEWGDDDFTQMIFFSVPKDFSKSLYLRIYDPECGGDVDEPKGPFDSKTSYLVYGGAGACSNEDARKGKAIGNYKSGNQLYSKVFTNESKYDKQWFTMGPINPSEGELLPDYGGNVFKVIIEGTGGDDGNLYKLFLSTSPNENKPVEGAVAFYFKYKFRLHDDPNEVSHIYPYMDDKVVSVRQANFDWDDDGVIRIISVAKNGEVMKSMGNSQWGISTHKVLSAEHNTSYDVQFIKSKTEKIKSNNVVFFIQNQYGAAMPFFSVPIGGIPKYKYSISIKPSGAKPTK